MRGLNTPPHAMFSYFSPEDRLSAAHPLRAMKASADAALAEVSGTFEAMYGRLGRPSIPPKRLLKVQS